MKENDKVTTDDMEKAIGIGIEKYISVRLGMHNANYHRGWKRAKQTLDRYVTNGIEAEAFIEVAERLFENHAFLLQKYREEKIHAGSASGSNQYHFQDGYCDLLYCVLEYTDNILEDS